MIGPGERADEELLRQRPGRDRGLLGDHLAILTVERGLDPSVMAPAPCHHAEAGMLARTALRAADRALKVPMALGYRWRHRNRRAR